MMGGGSTAAGPVPIRPHRIPEPGWPFTTMENLEPYG